jgi:hypothetical protein
MSLRSIDEFSLLADVDIPGWETLEAAAEWVRALRRREPVGVSTTLYGRPW